MIDIFVARAVHTVAVVLSIGSLAYMASILLPAIRRSERPERRLGTLLVHAGPYLSKTRVSLAILGLSGLYLTLRMEAWSRFSQPDFWWMHAMVGDWLILAVAFYIAEPLLRARIEHATQTAESEVWFKRIDLVHQLLLAASLLTILVTAGGSHGFIV